MGIRISEDYIRAERNALSLEEFQRERLGIFDPEATDAGDLAIDPDAWRSSFDGRSSIADTPTFALDVGPRGMAAIGTAGLRGDGLVHVEVVEHRETGQWVVSRAAELCERWDAQLVVDAAGGAGSFLPDLIAAGVPLLVVKHREVAAACGRFAALVKENGLRHLGSGELNAAAATAVRRVSGETFVWHWHSPTSPDLSPLYAVTLAAWPIVDDQPPEPAIY
jgi:hypothetical protein